MSERDETIERYASRNLASIIDAYESGVSGIFIPFMDADMQGPFTPMCISHFTYSREEMARIIERYTKAV